MSDHKRCEECGGEMAPFSAAYELELDNGARGEVGILWRCEVCKIDVGDIKIAPPTPADHIVLNFKAN